MSRQEHYREAYKRRNKDWIDSVRIYRDYASRYVCNGTRILDLGCGHVDFMRSVYSKTPYIYGVEPNKYTLLKNITISNKVVAIGEYIPFPDDFFDLVVSAWVLEHLDNPVAVFSEVYRVLKPSGTVVFLTPNSWNYITWINRAIPNTLHDFLVRKLYNREENDTYPVRYKVNSISRIRSVLLPIGFKEREVVFNGDPSYISFNDLLFKISCLIEKALDIGYLQTAKVHIIGAYEKI